MIEAKCRQIAASLPLSQQERVLNLSWMDTISGGFLVVSRGAAAKFAPIVPSQVISCCFFDGTPMSLSFKGKQYTAELILQAVRYYVTYA
ncbi:hypothetical protein [Shewanella xiamenensis]|uniref:hypothetical protein n=1 Tax=Shewanella xiamenensis TaxID=332186 RepID=UPI001187068B|nr:hypothetical protein [Shewanella xiamenensis]